MHERVAVVGSGVSGLVAAHMLQGDCQVSLFEADSRLGGHAHTQQVDTDNHRIMLDTGFMVFNEVNYPNLTKLFNELGVKTQTSDMSLAVSCAGCGLSYLAGSGLRGLPASAERVDPAVWSDCHKEVVRFNIAAQQVLTEGDEDTSFGELLVERGFSDFFIAHVAVPIIAAVWSCDAGEALEYPAGYLMRFMANHGLLQSGGGVRWRSVVGGSAEYVGKIAAGLTEVRLQTPVREVSRTERGVWIEDALATRRHFDRAVIATHPEQALTMLRDPTTAERSVLGAIKYRSNEAVLHTDTTVLSSRPGGWNYWAPSCGGSASDVVMTYHLNGLQRLPGNTDYLLTINGTDRIRPDTVVSKTMYEHPLYTRDSVRARSRLPRLSDSRIAFAGAYHGWGFHEDGCVSGINAAAAVGART